MIAYYYGCAAKNRPGHYWYSADPATQGWPRKDSEPGPEVPASLHVVDGVYTPKRDTHQGAAHLRHFDGWTVLAWHDYTGDQRPGSNSVLLAEGLHRFDEMLQVLRTQFPSVWNRQLGVIPGEAAA